MSTVRDIIENSIREMQKTRDMEIPCFTPLQIASLPNIFQLVEIIKKEEERILLEESGWEKYSMMPDGNMPLHPMNWHDDPHRLYINDVEPDKFIVNRLNSGRYCFKPNLRNHRLIFRGQKQHFSKIIPSLERGTSTDVLVSNVKGEDFIALLRSHPLFSLFEQGIHLYPNRKPFFFEMNYYGLAQHYNFNTGLVDFTSDISVAAFFATTRNYGNDKYGCYGGSNENPFGVIYVHNINPYASFFGQGYKTIGLQIYPRTGAQKGFFYQGISTRVPVEKTVTPLFFRHDIECSKKIFEMMDSGKRLFPEDDLSKKAQEIVNDNYVTGESFMNNLYYNHADHDTNLLALQNKGISVNWHKKRFFSGTELSLYYENLKNGWWEEFCKQIAFADKDENELMESLLKLPKNPNYIQFFNPRYLDLLQYHAIERRLRAEGLK